MGLTLGWNLFFAALPHVPLHAPPDATRVRVPPNPAVDLNDPDLFFVDIIPRINWGKAMMENASDIGFLELNRKPARARLRGGP